MNAFFSRTSALHRTVARALLLTMTLAMTAQAQSPSAPASTPVQTIAPSPAPGERTYTIPGRTEAEESSVLFSRVTGLVRAWHAEIGDRVTAGMPLVEIDTPEIDRAIESAQAAVDQARIRAENAQALAQRATSLLEARAISQEEAEERTAQAAERAAAVRLAEAEQARLQELQRFATVRAPYDGVIIARNVSRGDRVRGDAATAEGWLYRLVQLDPLRFVIAAPPELALTLTLGQEVSLHFGEWPDQPFVGRVQRRSGVFDPASGTMRVELQLANPEGRIPGGLTGTATFQLGPEAALFLLPTNALFYRQGQPTVAIVEEGRMQLQTVATGRNLGARIEVSSPALSLQTPVIVNPNALLQAGDPVTVTGSSRSR